MRTSPPAFRLAVLAAAALLVGLVAPAVRAADQVEQRLESAKALYRDGSFAQALVQLQLVIEELRPAARAEATRQRLGDAHLHVALSYVALNDPGAARESLKQLLRIDPAWRPDPDVHAPKVIDLFADARREVALEPAPVGASPPTPAPAVAPSPATTNKGGSRTVPIVLGVGGAAAAAVALGSSGGGPSGATTPTTTPTLSGSNDIALVTLIPPAGSTVVFGTVLPDCRSNVCFMFLYTFQASAAGCLQVTLLDPSSQPCGESRTTLTRGEGVPKTHAVGINLECGLPATIARARLTMATYGGPDQTGSCAVGSTVFERFIDLNYRVVP